MLNLILAALGGLLLGFAIATTLGAYELGRAKRRRRIHASLLERYRVAAGNQHPEWN